MFVQRLASLSTVLLLCTAMSTPAGALPSDRGSPNSDPKARTLKSRTSLAGQFGIAEGASTSTSVGVGGVETGTSGFGGSLIVLHWVAEEVAVEFCAGGMTAESRSDVGARGVAAETAVTVPLLAGVRYHPPAVKLRDNLLPYVSGLAGPYLGVETNEQTGAGGVSSEAGVEIAFGARMGAGIDWYLGPHFKLAGGFGYHAVTDFDKHVGTKRNHSGAEMTFALGWVF